MMDEATDKILDILEEYDMTVVDSIAILEIIKYNLLRMAETTTRPEGETLQ